MPGGSDRQQRRPNAPPARAGLGLILAGVACAAAAAAELPRTLDLSVVRRIPVQHDGRFPPLDTAARDAVETVTGRQFYRGHDPVLLLLAWTFDAPSWQQAPLISIPSPALRRELKLPAASSAFSYAELVGHHPLLHLIEDLSRRPAGRKLDPLESKVSDINDKLILLQEIFNGRYLRFVPDPDDRLARWRPIPAPGPAAEGPLPGASAAWARLRAAFGRDDGRAFAAAARELERALRELPAAYRPARRLIARELRYNRLRPFRAAWVVMVAGAALAALALLLRPRRPGLWRGPADVAALLVMVAGFGVLSYGLWLRWQIAGRIPAANMFESLLFLSWGTGAFAILSLLVLRDRTVPLTASAMGALALVLADTLPLDRYIRPVAPVLLDTVWMSIHVPIIMVSYSVLALAVLVAHVQLLALAAAPGRGRLTAALDGLHYWYVHVGSILLIAGIITGSMWAAASWGRYWGWDPKEVWSLVAFLGYMAILHVRIERGRVAGWMYALAAALGLGLLAMILPQLAPLSPAKLLALGGALGAMLLFVLARGPCATALKSILAFWLIIMTYVGVNFVLGTGLHSYAFGAGAVVHYLFRIGALDLALIGVCCLVYLARRPPPARARPATARR